jgi:hypothetical protein
MKSSQNARKSHRLNALGTISKDLLLKAAQMGPTCGYNRQLCDQKISRLPSCRYKIVAVIPHFHAFFQPVPEHRRFVVEIGNTLAFVDVPLDFAQRILNEAKAAKRILSRRRKRR